MRKELQHDLQMESQMSHVTLTRGMGWGLMGGLAATVVIDVITVGVLPLMGLPADGGFAVIGDTAAGFLTLLGINVAGGVLVGAVFHYLIGLALGAVFGAAVTRVDVLHLNSIKKGLGLGILYTEVISLPILVMPPIILKWTTPAAAQWFGFSFVMHAIWGITLGVVVSYGLGLATAVKRN
jgi:hypothetical protein